MSFFFEETSSRIRGEILMNCASANMSDSERASFFNLPAGCRIREGAKIIFQENLNMGKNVWVGENAILDARGGLEIGDNCQIGLSVFLWSHSTHELALQGLDTRKHQDEITVKKTVIGDNCFIAGPSVIMPGVSVGNNVTISPLSVVYKDLVDGAVYTPYRNFLSSHLKVKKLAEKTKFLEKQLKEMSKEIADLKMRRVH